MTRHLGDADGRALARGLDDQPVTELGDHLHPVGIGVTDPMSRRRNPRLEPDLLGRFLVDRDRRGLHPAAGVGNTQRFEHALDRAVLASSTVQRDEDAVETRGLQFGKRLAARIERMRVDAAAAQGVEHASARHDRDLALRRATAEQHADLAERCRRRSFRPRSGKPCGHLPDRARAHRDHHVAVPHDVLQRCRSAHRSSRRRSARPCRPHVARGRASDRPRRRSALRRRGRPPPAASASLVERTLTKSSKQSRVRV